MSHASLLEKLINELEYLLRMIILCDILFYVDMVGKKLQSEFTSIDVTISQISDVMNYFE